MSSSQPSKNASWGPSILRDVQFGFRNKVPFILDISPKIKNLQNPPSNYQFDCNLENDVIQLYLRTQSEKKKLKANCNENEKIPENENESQSRPTFNLDMLEPKKTCSSSGKATDTPPLLPPPIELSLVHDFEPQGPRDDPFVATELGTINDLDELRDVLASMPTVDKDVNEKSMCRSLKNISFPTLPPDEHFTTVAHSSAPASDSNLFSNSFVASDRSVTYSDDEHHIYNLTENSEHNGGESQKLNRRVDCEMGNEIFNRKSPSSEVNLPLNIQLTEPNVDDKLCSTSIFTSPIIPIPSPPHQNVLQTQSSVSNHDGVKNHPFPAVTEAQTTDSPVVQRLVNMGFTRDKILALYDAGVWKNHEEACQTLITQLCNWNDLEENGVPEVVGKAAVLFSSTDLNKAHEFADIVSRLTEMGFTRPSAIAAVEAAQMNEEAALTRLLDTTGQSVALTTTTNTTTTHGARTHGYLHRSNILAGMHGSGEKKGKKKIKNMLLSAKH